MKKISTEKCNSLSTVHRGTDTNIDLLDQLEKLEEVKIDVELLRYSHEMSP